MTTPIIARSGAPRASVLDVLEGPDAEVMAADHARTFPWSVASDAANRQPAQPLAVGRLVMIYSRGNYRLAVVEKIGPKRVQTVYTTPTSIAEGIKHGWAVTFTRKAVAIADVFEPLAV